MTAIEENQVVTRTTNLYAALSLFAALAGLGLPALVLGMIGGVQTKDNKQDGQAAAQVGALFGFVEVAVTVVVVILLINSGDDPEPYRYR